MEAAITKQPYLSPGAEIVEMSNEGIICASDVKGGNSINNWGDGGTTSDDLM